MQVPFFQYYPSERLRANLDKATAVGTQAFGNTSFCIDDLRLLPSNVVQGASHLAV